jgi:hypothetical protein
MENEVKKKRQMFQGEWINFCLYQLKEGRKVSFGGLI